MFIQFHEQTLHNISTTECEYLVRVDLFLDGVDETACRLVRLAGAFTWRISVCRMQACATVSVHTRSARPKNHRFSGLTGIRPIIRNICDI